MLKYVVFITLWSQPNVTYLGLIRGKNVFDAMNEALQLMVTSDEICTADVDTSEPYNPDYDMYLTDMAGDKVFGVNEDINSIIEFHQIFTKRYEPTLTEVGELIKHFEMVEDYEKCGELVKIFN